MSNVEQLFKLPIDEIRRMEGDFNKIFGTTMAQFIQQEAKVMASNFHDKCAHILVDRFIEMNKFVKELPAKPSKKQYQIINDLNEKHKGLQHIIRKHYSMRWRTNEKIHYFYNRITSCNCL